jgi:hypothetical protein
MQHGDTVGAEKAASEIGDAAKALDRIRGHKILTPFAIPGGVKWDIPKADFERILSENHSFLPGREDFYQDGHGDITRLPALALKTNTWHHLGFHGIEGEWLSTSLSNLTSLLDFLDKNRDQLWIAPTGIVWKYTREREALLKLDVKPNGTIVPIFDRMKLDPLELYSVPLTLQVPVPPTWKKVSASIDGKRVEATLKGHLAELEFLPQSKSIVVKKG